MEAKGRGAAAEALSICLPDELRLYIMSLLPPNDLALSGRLSSKDAAQRFSELHGRTADLRQPLPDYAVAAGQASAQTALRQLTFRQKLHLPATAAASGCEANVEFALQLLQPHVFPEVLRTDSGYTWAYSGSSSRLGGETLPPTADVGSAAVASGLVHLLPYLEQRCPGLLDPGRTMEAAAAHCDLAGLQAAGAVLGQRLVSSIWEKELAERAKHSDYTAEILADANGVWQRIIVEADGSSTPDALAKMALVLEKSNKYSRAGRSAVDGQVWGAAAASGDLARLRWLMCHRVCWQSHGALEAALQGAGVGFLGEMEQHGHLPPASHGGVWVSPGLDRVAAGCPRDSAAKLRWLEARGARIGVPDAVVAAAKAGNLEALQLLLERRRQYQLPAEGDFEMNLLEAAAHGGHVPTAAWLLQAGWALTPQCLESAVWHGDLPMLRWLVEAGCPRGDLDVSEVVDIWPCRTAVDSRRLVEALRLVVAAGWPSQEGESAEPWSAAMLGNKPWPVWCVLRELLPYHPDLHCNAFGLTPFFVTYAARTGCEAVLEGLVGEGTQGASIEWYDDAAARGDRGTLECVRRLGVLLEPGVLEEAVDQSAPLAAMRWLVEQGAPVGEEEVTRALKAVPAGDWRKQERREIKAWLRGLRGGVGGGVA